MTNRELYEKLLELDPDAELRVEGYCLEPHEQESSMSGDIEWGTIEIGTDEQGTIVLRCNL